MECTSNPDYLNYLNCSIKPLRNGHQLATLAMKIRKPLNDIWIHHVLYYKYGTVYRPFVFNETVDFCCAVAGKCNTHLLLTLAYSALKVFMPEFMHGCPYESDIGAHKIDIDTLQSFILPQVVPAGTYKLAIRFYTAKGTETFMNIVMVGTFHSRDPMAEFFMG